MEIIPLSVRLPLVWFCEVHIDTHHLSLRIRMTLLWFSAKYTSSNTFAINRYRLTVFRDAFKSASMTAEVIIPFLRNLKILRRNSSEVEKVEMQTAAGPVCPKMYSMMSNNCTRLSRYACNGASDNGFSICLTSFIIVPRCPVP